VKLALLKGNRFNPWHLQPYRHLGEDVHVAMFRADSEIQQHFAQRDDGPLTFDTHPIHFDTQAGPPLQRIVNRFRERVGGREPRILPFADQLADFDLVQSWELFTDWSAEAVKAKKRYRMPLAVMVWDNVPFNMERDPHRRATKQQVAAAADRFIVHTDRSRRILDIEGIEEERIIQLNPGIDLERFVPGPPAREALGLPHDDFLILFVGWLLPRKGIDFLILALRELVRDKNLHGRPIRLVMVGSGPGRDRVDRLIERLGVRDACTFLGAMPYGRMPEVYRTADAFVLPSIAMPEWQEQFGMALIEAMACGVPVVASLTGAIPEIAGDAAILTQANDFPALYEALKALILDDKRRADLAAAGRARAEQRYSVAQCAQALSTLYRELLS